jgi:methyl-accepting chemotaxis protein
MDQVVQQNAAMVEQSTAATHAMKAETVELDRLVRRFRLGSATAAQAASPGGQVRRFASIAGGRAVGRSEE